jgi:hypothetical protein
LRQQRVGKRHHPHRSVFLRRAQSLGEAKQRMGEPPFDTADRKAFDPASELGAALREDLEQRHRKAYGTIPLQPELVPAESWRTLWHSRISRRE